MNACVTQCGRRSVDVGGLEGFSRFCLEIGVDPKYSDGTIGVFCCETYCSDERVKVVV